MLVVRVEVWPGGDSDKAYEISRVGIANTSGAVQFSSYDVTAIMGRDGCEEVLKTEVRDHDRDTGWAALVRRVMTNLFLRHELCAGAPYDDPTATYLRRGGHGAKAEAQADHRSSATVEHSGS